MIATILPLAVLSVVFAFSSANVYFEDVKLPPVGTIIDNIPPKTVDMLDQTAYAGRWFQMYTSIIPNKTFENNAYCITADYTIVDGATFDLVNSAVFGGPTGTLNQYKGQLVLPDPTQPGKWFLKGKHYGFYWVVAVGDKNVNGLYDWAVVTTPFKIDLFVLARDPATFDTKYGAFIKDYLEKADFNKPFNFPLETYQNGLCAYNW